jgi:hypothetical protein
MIVHDLSKEIRDQAWDIHEIFDVWYKEAVLLNHVMYIGVQVIRSMATE